MASLTLGSMNFAREPSMNSPEMIRSLAERMKERDIVPECEVFEVGMAEYMRYLADREILAGPFYANILLGSLGTLRATRENLDLCVRALPEGTVWAVAGIGRFQEDASELALSAGGHVRIGLEDNIWYDRERTRKARNAELVERVERRAAELGRDVASPAEARRIIGLPDPLR
jgi:uncharacterized protein (DUF849 family)